MGTPVTAQARRHISLRLPSELLTFIDTQAAAAFQSRSQYLTSLVADAYIQARDGQR